jgi:hypothetical protein
MEDQDRTELQHAREIVALAEAMLTPAYTWTRHATARNGRGRVVKPTAPTARRWCAVGALIRAREMLKDRDIMLAYGVTGDIPRLWNEAYARAIAETAGMIERPRGDGLHAIAEYNDRARSRLAVLKLFARVIELLDARLAQAAS